MRKMSTTLIALLIVWTSVGCRNFPTINSDEIVTRCVVSFRFNKCRCHDYQISRDGVGRVSSSVDRPVAYCEGAVAFPEDSWADIQSWYVEVFQWLEDRENND